MLALKQARISKSSKVIYCDNIGEIDRYSAIDEESNDLFGLTLKSDNLEYYLTDRVIAVRNRGYITLNCSRKGNNDSETFRKAMKRYKELGGYCADILHTEIIDPRVIRTYILMYYEYVKGKSVSEVSKILNEEKNVTIEEAYKWLEVNRFPALREFKYVENTNDKELEKYRYDFSKLVKR